MKRSVHFHEDADAELTAAGQWYDSKSSGLGTDFLDEAWELFQHIQDWPELARVYPNWNRDPVVRTRSLRRFPFQVCYYLTEAEIFIIAVAHHKRKDAYWAEPVSH